MCNDVRPEGTVQTDPHHHSTQPLETSKLAGQPRGATAAHHRGDSAGAAILQPACFKGALQMVVRRPQSKIRTKNNQKTIISDQKDIEEQTKVKITNKSIKSTGPDNSVQYIMYVMYLLS